MIRLCRNSYFLLFFALGAAQLSCDETKPTEIDRNYRIEYYASGRMKSKELLQNNLRNGDAYYYSEDGKCVERGEYLNEQKSGCWVTYFPDGKIESFKEYFHSDSSDETGASRYPNRFVDFHEDGTPNYDQMTLYYDFYPKDTLGESYYILSLEMLIVGMEARIIFAHGDSLGAFDTIPEKENPIMFRLRSKKDYIYGKVENVGRDTILANGERGYNTITAYFDSRKPPCNLADFEKKK